MAVGVPDVVCDAGLFEGRLKPPSLDEVGSLAGEYPVIRFRSCLGFEPDESLEGRLIQCYGSR